MCLPDEIDRIEVSRGASTSVFGDRAMGGAIAIFSREPEPGTVRLAYEGGNENTHELSVGGSHLIRKFGVSGEVRAFTNGRILHRARLVARPDRYSCCRGLRGWEPEVRYSGGASAVVRKARHPGGGSREWHLSSAELDEPRNAFRQLFVAACEERDFGAGISHTGGFPRLVFSHRRGTRDRTADVPASGSFAGRRWGRILGLNQGSYNLLAGADVERVEGVSTDHLVDGTNRAGGGTRLQHGTFAQFNAGTPTARVFLGGRYQFTGDETFFSPSAGFALGRGRFRFPGSGYRSFRAPTLNELYREFRVGNAVTLPNAALRSETLTGGEIGLEFAGESTHLTASLFRNNIDHIITNVTLSLGATITRQRQNATAALAQGFETNLQKRWRDWTGEAAYLFVDSRYESGPRVPQVPKHQGSAQLTYAHGRTLASAAVRSFSYQFEDDINQFVLAGFASVQLMVREQFRMACRRR